MIVNAEGQVLGRLASFVAKQALLGDEVIVVNAEKALVSGKGDMVRGKELEKLDIRNIGNTKKGPFHQKRPDKYVRKAVRGMLPWKKASGREAFKRIQVYIGIPEDVIKKVHNVGKIEIHNLDDMKKGLVEYTTVAEICKSIGGKW
ncbi:MAG: 50S ribosomal protein L13 [Candidatus Altiarchaeota archaeon]|nr:50S ribosomal protein L13 [Candidatus Altiarchaeota archaeon]